MRNEQSWFDGEGTMTLIDCPGLGQAGDAEDAEDSELNDQKVID